MRKIFYAFLFCACTQSVWANGDGTKETEVKVKETEVNLMEEEEKDNDMHWMEHRNIVSSQVFQLLKQTVNVGYEHVFHHHTSAYLAYSRNFDKKFNEIDFTIRYYFFGPTESGDLNFSYNKIKDVWYEANVGLSNIVLFDKNNGFRKLAVTPVIGGRVNKGNHLDLTMWAGYGYIYQQVEVNVNGSAIEDPKKHDSGLIIRFVVGYRF